MPDTFTWPELLVLSGCILLALAYMVLRRGYTIEPVEHEESRSTWHVTKQGALVDLTDHIDA